MEAGKTFTGLFRINYGMLYLYKNMQVKWYL